jgi:hypothetical protein
VADTKVGVIGMYLVWGWPDGWGLVGRVLVMDEVICGVGDRIAVWYRAY